MSEKVQTTLQSVTIPANDKDGRWAKQFGDFAEHLALHVLGQGKNMSIALVDHVGADLFAANRNDTSKRYAISVKGRIFPEGESKHFTFDDKNVRALSDTAHTFGMIPAVALVFVDDQEEKRKIRVFFATLENIEKLAKDPAASFVSHHTNGVSYIFRLTEGKRAHYLSENFQGENQRRWSHLIDYTEIAFEIFDPDIIF